MQDKTLISPVDKTQKFKMAQESDDIGPLHTHFAPDVEKQVFSVYRISC